MTLFAQTDYYYYQGDKIELTIDQSKLKIILSDDYLDQRVTLPLIKSFNLDQLEIQDNDHSRLGTAELNGILSDKMFQETVEALRRLKEVDNIAYYYKRTSSSSIATSNIFYVKLMDKNDLKVLEKIALEKDVKIVHQNRFMPLWYRLELKKNIQKTALELSNEFFETGLFESVDPAFMFDFSPKCTNDGNFNDLWGLDNNTTPGIDINICNAWNISEGNGVTVAVLDQGVFVNHNDLDANISNLSYDTENGTSPSVFVAGNIHGTHVAGTIAAEKDNNLQIVGVAPESEIMSVSNRLEISNTVSEELADGLNWATQNGADVINNSWGDQGGQFYNQLHSQLLENAITNALNNGRNGKGTVLVFASGNSSPAIDYPANFDPDILCVGAIDINGSRANFSGYGSDLDVVAPGVDILSTVPNQGTASLNGTSMAAPHVSGLAALILSKNPDLDVEEVNNIIEKTTKKIGGYGYSTTSGRPNGKWDDEAGYGLINAYSALQSTSFKINGPSQFCPSASYSINPKPSSNSTISWSVSPSNAGGFSSTNSISTTFTRNSGFSGSATITATINGDNT
ncbi:MAG: S8 family serine peptidase, partial [Melioribacteraceae bacterium]|nr:S8 family serine peptidase [Melioribacteraceae bacterium]